jgi:uncharacterized membrane protein
MTNLSDPRAPGDAGLGAIAVVAAIVLAYAALSYYSESTPAAVGLATGLSVGPVLLILGVLLWRWNGRLIAGLAIVVGGVTVYLEWPLLVQHYPWSNLIQQCGAYALAAFGFARSLRVGQVPLCAQVLEKVHGPLTDPEISYTRRATLAWAIFYALLTTVILLLFLFGSPRIWSLFTNVGTYALIALMFAADHLMRGRVLPRRDDGGMLAALRHLFGGA